MDEHTEGLLKEFLSVGQGEGIAIAVVGSRGFDDFSLFERTMDKLLLGVEKYSFVSGGAGGADTFAERYAKERNIQILVITPNWEKYGRAAGFRRNEEIWNHSAVGVAFYDGQSKGTAHSFQISKKQGKRLFVCEYLQDLIYLSA